MIINGRLSNLSQPVSQKPSEALKRILFNLEKSSTSTIKRKLHSHVPGEKRAAAPGAPGCRGLGLRSARSARTGAACSADSLGHVSLWASQSATDSSSAGHLRDNVSIPHPARQTGQNTPQCCVSAYLISIRKNLTNISWELIGSELADRVLQKIRRKGKKRHMALRSSQLTKIDK